jgi:hypothetical protein
MPLKRLFLVLAVTSLTAIFMTWLAWRSVFSAMLKSIFPSWTLDAFLWLGMWPCLLLEKLGWEITNHSSGLLQSVVGWNLVVIIGILSYRLIQRKGITNRCSYRWPAR